MSTKIPFWDKIYYREYHKNFLLIDRHKNEEDWQEIKKNNEKYQNNLLVFPAAGLGNRLRVIAASWNIAQKLKKKLHFYWSVTPDIGCMWDDIFCLPKMHWNDNPLEFSKQIHSKKKRQHAINDMIHIGFEKQNILYNQKYQAKDINIYSCWLRDFPRKGIFFANKFFSLLHPSKKVQKLLLSFLTPERKKLGLHIRYTDAPLKRDEAWIIEWIRYLVKKYPKHEIVLVSDNQKIKDRILAILPLKRVCYQKTNLTSNFIFSTDRANLQGMQIAIADLFALAACEIFWANKPNSSFYQAALFMAPP